MTLLPVFRNDIYGGVTHAPASLCPSLGHSKYKLIQESAENFSQTSANDDGLWDYQDGLTREVSRFLYTCNYLERMSLVLLKN